MASAKKNAFSPPGPQVDPMPPLAFWLRVVVFLPGAFGVTTWGIRLAVLSLMPDVLAPESYHADHPAGLAMSLAQWAGRLSLIVSAFLWLLWQSSARRRLGELGERHLSYPRGWSVVVWFIPLVNLFAPYTLTDELVYRSARDHSTTWDPMEEPSSTPWELVLWWGTWCGWFVLVSAAGRNRDWLGEDLWTLARVITSGVALLAAFFGGKVISRVERGLRG